MEYQVKGEVGKEIVVLPDTSNSMYYKLQGVPGEAYRKMNEKDSSGKLIPWLMKIEVFNPKTNKQIGTGFINYFVVSMTTSILNDPEKLEWDVQSVSEAEDALAKLSHSFSGTVEGTYYDDAKGLCVMQTKGTVVSNYDSSIYGTGNLEGYTKVATDKVNKQGCENLNGSGQKVMFDDIRAMKDYDGSDATYFTDTGSIKIGDGDETVSYLKESSLIEEFTTSVESSDGYGMILDPKLIYDKDGNLQIAENKTYNGERQLCKDVPTCRSYVEEKLNRNIDEITFKLDENGIPKAYDLEGNYIGAGNESGFTKQITSNQVIPNSHADEILSRIQNYGGEEIPTGIEHVISLNYNTNGIAIKDVARSDGGTLSQKPEDKSSSQAVNFLREFGNGIADVVKRAPDPTSIIKATFDSDIDFKVGQSATSNLDTSVWDKFSNLLESSTFVSVRGAKNPEEASKTAIEANKGIQVLASGAKIGANLGAGEFSGSKEEVGETSQTDRTTTTVKQNPDGTTSIITTGTTNDEDFLARLRELRRSNIR